MSAAASFIGWFRLSVDVGVGALIVAAFVLVGFYRSGTARQPPESGAKAFFITFTNLTLVAVWLLWLRGYVTALMAGA